MPEWEPTHFTMPSFEPLHDAEWSLDEALVLLLLSRITHPDLERKQAAIEGLAGVISRRPTIVTRALADALGRDMPLTSVLLILSTLLEAELTPFICTQAVAGTLRTLLRSDLFGMRMLAERLLSRIALTEGR